MDWFAVLSVSLASVCLFAVFWLQRQYARQSQLDASLRPWLRILLLHGLQRGAGSDSIASYSSDVLAMQAALPYMSYRNWRRMAGFRRRLLLVVPADQEAADPLLFWFAGRVRRVVSDYYTMSGPFGFGHERAVLHFLARRRRRRLQAARRRRGAVRRPVDSPPPPAARLRQPK